jgi:PAP2 superfamily
MKWINSIYSFIHIPATISFLVWLFWYTETSTASPGNSPVLRALDTGYAVHRAALFEARRRTMALCNLVAFIIFTAWPCMPPRLLSDPNYHGPAEAEAKSFGFVDTVHSGGQASVWTTNKFQNQYAAMPSLHFGYSLLVGLTIMTIPIKQTEGRRLSASGIRLNLGGMAVRLRLPSAQRALALTIGFLYPAIILIAIVSTANHFILDAVAGAWVCGLSWQANHIMLNLLPLRDWLFWAMRAHIPENPVVMFEK